MDIFSLFTLCGGLAFFLFGMSMLSNGLEKMAGGKLESFLKKNTENKLRGLLLGAAITVAIQSSSSVTVMLVGLVNSGIMQLGQTIGVIMGSNIGTTVTAWLLATAGLESDNLFIRLINPDSFAPLLSLMGILFYASFKSDKKKSIGTVLIGFSILMTGMDMMKDSLAPLALDPRFEKFLLLLNNPVIAVLIGVIVTALLHSSAASVGLLQALAMNGIVTYSMALPIVMGQNIGTCVTALISSIGVSKNARRVSLIHLLFNVIGTIVFLSAYLIVDAAIVIPISAVSIDGFGIALTHSVFNVATTILLFPFIKQLEKFANFIIKDDISTGEEPQEVYTFIDDRLLSTPSVAIRESNSKCKKMAGIARDTIFMSLDLVDKYDKKTSAKILENEDLLDMYEDKLGTFLVKLSGKELSAIDSQSISRQLHTIGDFERIGDHAVNIQQVAEEIHEKNLHFSQAAQKEISIIKSALTEVLGTTIEAYTKNNVSIAKKVEPLEE
ncbi:MAG: Na/Pi cotransporter family protein, partial [Clostridia bacterium]|nr:Na/Pi cotransporter family protein [Clostridia bacterium]